MNLNKITHSNNANDTYGWICFQSISIIDIQVENMFSDKEKKIKETKQTGGIRHDPYRIHSICHDVDQDVMITLRILRSPARHHLCMKV